MQLAALSFVAGRKKSNFAWEMLCTHPPSSGAAEVSLISWARPRSTEKEKQFLAPSFGFTFEVKVIKVSLASLRSFFLPSIFKHLSYAGFAAQRAWSLLLASRNIVYLSLFYLVLSVFAAVFFTLILFSNKQLKSENKATRSKRATEIGSLALSQVAFDWEIWISDFAIEREIRKRIASEKFVLRVHFN